MLENASLLFVTSRIDALPLAMAAGVKPDCNLGELTYRVASFLFSPPSSVLLVSLVSEPALCLDLNPAYYGLIIVIASRSRGSVSRIF